MSKTQSFRGWLGAAHPWPTAVVVTLTALIGLASAGERVDLNRLLLLSIAMLGNQLAIGWSNDYLDRDSDRLYQPAKPVPAGAVPPRLIAWSAVLALAVSLISGIVLGLWPFSILLCGTAAGLAYNLGLKDTRFSWLPYLVAFSLIPPFGWAALDVFEPRYLWLYPVAIPLAIAAHIANSLPDAEADARAGRRGLVVILGLNRSFLLLAACLVIPALLLVLAIPLVSFDLAVLGIVLCVYGLLLIGIRICYRRNNPALAFKLVSLAALLFVTGSLAAL